MVHKWGVFILEFRSFAYADLQKTGSTFLSRVLREVANEEVVHYRQHGPLRASVDSALQVFISVRQPKSYYQSLLSYGRLRKGGLFKSVSNKGLGAIYDSSTTVIGFQQFLANPEVQQSLPDHFPFGPSAEASLLTQRFLKITGFSELNAGLSALKLPFRLVCPEKPVIFMRQEKLLQDLRWACKRFPQYFSIDRLESATSIGRVNASYSGGKSSEKEIGRLSSSPGRGGELGDPLLWRFLDEVYTRIG